MQFRSLAPCLNRSSEHPVSIESEREIQNIWMKPYTYVHIDFNTFLRLDFNFYSYPGAQNIQSRHTYWLKYGFPTWIRFYINNKTFMSIFQCCFSGT